jgi:hypothetical protein
VRPFSGINPDRSESLTLSRHMNLKKPIVLMSFLCIGTVLSTVWAAWYFTIGTDDVARRRYQERYFGASLTRAVDGRFIPAPELGNSDYCGHCHTDIFHQWDASTHHFSSFNDPYYRRVALDVVARRGSEPLKLCAGCHDPLPLIGGEMPLKNLETWAGNAGITCLSCHRIVELHGHENGGYSLSPPTLHPFALTDRPFMQKMHSLLVKFTPFLHRQVLMKPFYRSSEFCTGCHTVRVPKAINGAADLVVQDESRHNDKAAPAGHPPVAQKACQDCHMPLVRSNDPAAHNGFIRSHRFVGGNTAIPFLNRDADQLQATLAFLEGGAIEIAIADVKSAGDLEHPHTRSASRPGIDLAIRVKNRGVGHSFPGGTADSNEAWVEIEVRDAGSALVFESGRAGAAEELPEGTYTFGTRFVDRDGIPTDRRTTATEAVAVQASTVLAPEEVRTLHYKFGLPAGACFPLTVAARLNWRKFSPHLAEWAFEGRRVESPPITILSHAEMKLAQLADSREPGHVISNTTALDSDFSARVRR